VSTAVFDAGVVSCLTGDPRDAAFAPELVTRYRRLLPERVRRIGVALDAEDRDVTMDAVLSLKSSSALVGAGELHDLAVRIERHVRREEPAPARAVLALIADAAGRADRALAAYLGTVDDTADA
jgi:HPt (histidine-containing phosphotransfer) domain-containing protein